MTVELEIFTILKALVSNRVYPDVAPDDAVMPYIVFQQAGGTAPSYVESLAPNIKNGRFQISAWSLRRADTAALALLIEAALTESGAVQAKPLGSPIAVHEDDTKRYGSHQDFSIWSNR